MIPARAKARGAETPSKRHGHAVPIVLGLFLPLCSFTALAASVAGGGALGWDRTILRFCGRYYQHSPASALEVFLDVSTGLGAAAAVGIVITLWTKRRRSQALFVALSVGGVALFDLPLKEIFQRPPLGDPRGGYSFPSGNAMASVAIVAAIAATSSPPWRRRVVIVGVTSVVVYGTALVFQWWHYPSDVLGGWCISLAWVTGLWIAVDRTMSGGRSHGPMLDGRSFGTEADRAASL